MVADGADLGGLLALDDRAAVAALPLVHADLDPDLALLDVRRERAVPCTCRTAPRTMRRVKTAGAVLTDLGI